MIPPPKGIIFDFGNVIARIDNTVFLGILLGKPKEACRDSARRIFGESSLSRDFETGRIGLTEFQRGVEAILEQVFSPEEFSGAYCKMFQPIGETFELIRFLRGKCRLGLLSNTNPLHFEKVFQAYAICPLFDQVTLSYQVGVMKPGPEIFRDALQKANLPPRDLLYLDDIPEFVEAAKEHGLQSRVFDDPKRVTAGIRTLFI